MRAKPSEKRYVFVLGAPRSGTTLLQLLIASHSEFRGCAGESGVFTKQNLFDIRRRYCGLSEVEVSRLLCRCDNIVGFFDALASIVTGEGKHRFVEKTPQHVLVLSRLLRWFPVSQFVHIVRDGRDCYCSAQSNSDVPQRHEANRFARYWKKCLRARQEAGNTKRIFDIRYEDLVHDPQSILENVMTFLEVEYEHSQIFLAARAGDARAIQPAFKRLAESMGSESVGRWRSELNLKEKQVFARLVGNELHRYGYL